VRFEKSARYIVVFNVDVDVVVVFVVDVCATTKLLRLLQQQLLSRSARAYAASYQCVQIGQIIVLWATFHGL